MIRYDMKYSLHEDRWFIGRRGREYVLNCGEIIELYIGKTAIPCRLELADKWYVIMDNTSFDLRENEQYMINL